jgi:hypothetical protein
LSVIFFCCSIASILYLWINAVHNEIYESRKMFIAATVALVATLLTIFSVVIAFAVLYGAKLTLEYQFYGEFFYDYSVLVVSCLLLLQGIALLVYALLTRLYLRGVEDVRRADSSASSSSRTSSRASRFSRWSRASSTSAGVSMATLSSGEVVHPPKQGGQYSTAQSRGLDLVTTLIAVLVTVFVIRLVVCFFSVLDPVTNLGFAVYYGLSIVLPEIVGLLVVLASCFLFWERNRLERRAKAKIDKRASETVKSASSTGVPALYMV